MKITSYPITRDIRIGRIKSDPCEIVFVLNEDGTPMDLTGKVLELVFLTGNHAMLTLTPDDVDGNKAVFALTEEEKDKLYANLIYISVKLDGVTIGEGRFEWGSTHGDKSELPKAIGINVNHVAETIEWFEVTIGPRGPKGELTEEDKALLDSKVQDAESAKNTAIGASASASNAASSANSAAITAGNAATAAGGSATAAGNSATAAAGSATSASNSATAAGTAKDQAIVAKNAAELAAATIDKNGEVAEGDVRLVSGDKVYDSIIGVGYPIFENEPQDESVGVSTNDPFWTYESSTFSAHGSAIGTTGKFNKLRFKLRGWRSDELPTVVTVRLRENNRSGTILYQQTFPFTTGVPNDIIEIETGPIETLQPLWFEYLTNGWVGGFFGSIESGDALGGYTTTKNPHGTIEQNVVTNRRIWVEFTRSRNTYKLTDFGKEKIGSEITIDKSLFPYFGGKKTPKYTSVASGAYNLEASTFSGWGCGIGSYAGTFSVIRLKLRGWKNDEQPTTVRVRLRDNNYNGSLIVNQVIPYNPDIEGNIEVVLENSVTVAGQLWFEYLTDGRVGYYGTGGNYDVGQLAEARYTSNKNINSATLDGIVSSERKRMIHVVLLEQVIDEYQLTPDGAALLRQELGIEESFPSVILNSKTVLFPGLEYNVYTANLLVNDYGDHTESSVDFSASYGLQKKRGYRYVAVAGHTFNLNVRVTRQKGESTKVQNISAASAASGNGLTRKILIIGDSTVANNNISTPLKSIFDPDVMNIDLIGTQGAVGVRHEGRGGWTVADYYGYGRALHVFNVTGVTTPPSLGATYNHNGVVYTIAEVNLSGGAGYFSASGTSAPLASGTLTKATGAGDATITFSSSSTTSGNPFYNPSTQHFDLQYYLTETGQSLGAGDWIFFQLGINDMFGQTSASGAQSKATQMLEQMDYIVYNIHAYNSSIRIGIVITFPPANQDAFAANYASGQTSEIYKKVGLLSWQKALLTTYDNDTARGNNIHLVPAHLNLDCDYNYPTVNEAVNARNTTVIQAQSNGVHPAASGYAQIADMYAGLIKYYG